MSWSYITKNTSNWSGQGKPTYTDYLLLESSDRILQENNDRIILEQAVVSYTPSWNGLNKNTATWSYINKS